MCDCKFNLFSVQKQYRKWNLAYKMNWFLFVCFIFKQFQMGILIPHFLNCNLEQDCNSSFLGNSDLVLKASLCNQTLQKLSFFVCLFLKFAVLFSDSSLFCNIVPTILRTHFLFLAPDMFSVNQKILEFSLPINTFLKVKKVLLCESTQYWNVWMKCCLLTEYWSGVNLYMLLLYFFF